MEPPGAPPDLRILQANERTLLAWVRTGLTLMAFGFVIGRLTVWLRLEHPEHDGEVALALGVAGLVLGVGCQVVGATRFVIARRAVIERRPSVPNAAGPVTIALVVGLLGASSIAYLLATA